ncbi:type II and III secretion system protein family protein (plasmid) [Photobacterium sp. DA100]|uniref:type II and III secretion system protein family protein n=1 Tax=Photobacterium sp. DA100 TaxID=3027472 RepID=UPI00247A52B8|nr:type II and III secretion system protein family protein [Photobacterium sp. DA100]WEM45625.1 type II and III secretion system protein family protein [Photobacterium sp. DA100]
MESNQNSLTLSRSLLVVIVVLFSLLLSSEGFAARTQSIAVPQHKSRLIEIPGSAKKISIGNPDVADILILRSNKIYVLGKALGTTNVIVWDSRGRLITVLDVEVTHDLNALKAKLYEFMPQEKISVYTSQNKLVLGGDVSSAEKIAMAEEIANTFTGKDTGIINLMNVGGSHQIMLEVTVAEVQRSLIREFDSNFVFARNNSNWTWGTVNGGASIPVVPPVDDAGNIITEIISAPLNIEDNGLFASYLSGSTLFSAAFSIAKTNGLAKVLAEPTLTALSGESAEFLSGGEFPIPVPNDENITIEFKEFGVGLQFVPTVSSSDSINLALNIEVSEITNQNAVTVSPSGTASQFFVPALSKRSAKTTVELGNGQTIGIAGLLNETVTDVVDKLPGLGDLPVIGQLFRSQSFRKGETELVILVTPRLAKPVRRQDLTLPTDSFVEPNDWEFYLLGRMSELKQSNENNAYRQATPTSSVTLSPSAGSEGQFGHSL